MISESVVRVVLFSGIAVAAPCFLAFCWYFFREGGFGTLFENDNHDCSF
jgi:hypothetical protein